jgi:hypothetical protein
VEVSGQADTARVIDGTVDAVALSEQRQAKDKERKQSGTSHRVWRLIFSYPDRRRRNPDNDVFDGER